ncbi:Insect cuticle protein [Trinorchestia longiramus]|nr:Insect cuticle protein [Trinorchestia longiramus]
MASARCWMMLSVMVAIQAMATAQTLQPPRTTTHDSDEVDEGSLNQSEILKTRSRGENESDDESNSNSRSGRQLSRFGQNPYDQQFGLSRFGSTNLLGTRNQFGSSSILGSSSLNGLNTPEIFNDYQTRNSFGEPEFGTRLQTSPGSNPFSGVNSNQLRNTQLLGNRLGANNLQRNNFGADSLSNGLLSNQQQRNRQFSSNYQLGNHLLRKSQLVNTLRNQYAASQRFGNQILTPEGVARTVVHDSQNDGFGQYSYQFKTDNGIVQEQTGQLVGPGALAVTGSYSYTSPEGELVTVRYVADENGFQVESPNIPPIPEHARLQLLAAQQARNRGLIDSNGNPTGLRSNFPGNILGTAGLGLNRNIGLGSRSGLLNPGYRTNGLQNFNTLNNGFRSG